MLLHLIEEIRIGLSEKNVEVDDDLIILVVSSKWGKCVVIYFGFDSLTKLFSRLNCPRWNR